MVSRRDQYQAHRFLADRYAAALLQPEPDATSGPLHRLRSTATASVVVAALVAAAIGAYGLLRPGNATTWRDGRSLLVERETGSRYVYLDGVLHPVVNYASARLILRGSAAPLSVSRAALGGTPRGAPVGIPGAPEALPRSGDLLPGPWTVCNDPGVEAQAVARPQVRVTVGGATPAGTSAVAEGDGVLIGTADGTRYVLVDGQRLRLAAGYVLAALNDTAAHALPVGDAFANVLPQGPDLAAPPVRDVGGRAPDVASAPTKVGQLFAVDTRYFLALRDGLAPVTPLQAQLLLASQSLAAAYPGRSVEVIQISAAAASAAPRSVSTVPEPAGIPTDVVHLLDTSNGQRVLCIGVNADRAEEVTVGPADTRTVDAPQTAAPDSLGVPVADSIVIATGRGAVVRTRPAPGVDGTTRYLVTDDGTKYPLGDDQRTLTDLGLAGATPVPLPPGMVALFRTGPTLSEAAAARTVPLPGDAGSPLAYPS